jgi:HPt (histidine-containing phosphotransfer) domain-containing protein
MQGFLAKPISKPDLVRVLNVVLGQPDGTNKLQTEPYAECDVQLDPPVCEVDSRFLAEIRLDLGEEVYQTVVTTCIQSLRELLEEIKAALPGDNSAGLAKAGHRLKGVAGNYGLLSLYRLACRLEKAARQEDRGRMQSSGVKLGPLVDSCIDYLQSHNSKQPGSFGVSSY